MWLVVLKFLAACCICAAEVILRRSPSCRKGGHVESHHSISSMLWLVVYLDLCIFQVEKKIVARLYNIYIIEEIIALITFNYI